MSVAIGNLLTTAEVAELLKVSEVRVRQFHKNKRLKGRKIGTILLFSQDEVEEFATLKRPSGRRPNAG